MYTPSQISLDNDPLESATFLRDADPGSTSSIFLSGHKSCSKTGMVSISGVLETHNASCSTSSPSSIGFGDSHDISDNGDGHMDRTDCGTSISSGTVNDNSHKSTNSNNSTTQDMAPSQLPLPQYNGSQPTRYKSSTTTTNQLSPSQRILNGVGIATTTGLGPIAIEEDINGSENQQEAMARIVLTDVSAAKGSSPPKTRTHPSDSSPGKTKVEFRARSSLPSSLAPEEIARQSILAAESSRLNPFALHPGEYSLLRTHITPTQVTIYLNIRNAILRLWTRNPLVKVSLTEAVGCARETRYFEMAKTAYYWLLRNGYINFGCVYIDPTLVVQTKSRSSSRKSILVIGAGMSGLGCARQLEGLFVELANNWTDRGEALPKVTVLEARPRVGGRVYSHHLENQTTNVLPAGYRCTAEMGAQIVTGFERGNPLNVLIRGQLAIPYHGLRDNTIFYDYDGKIVDRDQDLRLDKLFNDILDRASVYRNKPASFKTAEGNRDLIMSGLDPTDPGGQTIATMEESGTSATSSSLNVPSKMAEKPSSGVEKVAGRSYQLTAGSNTDISASKAAMTMGWSLKKGVPMSQTLDLDAASKASAHPTLGEVMDEGVKQYQDILNLTPQDLRLLNWHYANLEYANAVNINQLSLSGWDEDLGNEFEGEHTQIIGGYQQVPRGLWKCPQPLDVRFRSPVATVRYDPTESGDGKAVRVQLKDGEVFEADKLVITVPLGVLKTQSITFDPPLPDWKQGVIERMGFGLLNKVVLIYDRPFWEEHRDMFGALNEAMFGQGLNQSHYADTRGRFYLFWNCIKTSGRPMLVALMAGNSALEVENSADDDLVREVTDRLGKMFAPEPVPLPSEYIVTRWRKDPFARGSYSYVGPTTQTGDYDVMAKSHGPLHFAGEATCGTHPATVHGAYLSGLRAAAEVVESLIGPIQVPTPLIERRVKHERSSWAPAVPASTANNLGKRSSEVDGGQGQRGTLQSLADEYEAAIMAKILSELGERPIKPGKSGANPFLLYTKDQWYNCKAKCDEARKAATGDTEAKASRTEIRTALGLMWRTASESEKKPYLDQAAGSKEEAAKLLVEYNERSVVWDREAKRIRDEYVKNHPYPSGSDGTPVGLIPAELVAQKRLRRA